MPVEGARTIFILPDVSVDRLVADAEQTIPLQSTGYLLGAPVLSQELDNLAELALTKSVVSA
jgi:hypothetical protein